MSRGAVFEKEEDGYWFPARETYEIANKAIEDIAAWLGYETVQDYVQALPREGKRIFDRAED